MKKMFLNLLRMLLCRKSLEMLAAVGLFAYAGCVPTPPTPPPDKTDIFNPAPNHDFDSSTGTVEILKL